MKTTRPNNINGCSVDFANNVIIINFKFQKAAKNPSSNEFALLTDLLTKLPGFTVCPLPGKVITKARPTKRLTYKNMETYIKTYENAEELMKQFEIVKQKSAPLASPYKYVRKWFVAQFPQYNVVQINNPEAQNAAVAVVDAPNENDFPRKPDKAA